MNILVTNKRKGMWSIDIAALILNIDITWIICHLHATTDLPSKIRHWFQIRCRLFLPLKRYGKYVDEINLYVAWYRNTIPLVFSSYLTDDTYLIRPYVKGSLTNKKCVFSYILSLSLKHSRLDVRGIKRHVYDIIGTKMLRRRNCEFNR